MGAGLHLAGTCTDLIGLIADCGDIAGDAGHNHRALGHIFVDLGYPLGSLGNISGDFIGCRRLFFHRCGNGIDDNCNGQVDENCTAACQNATNLTTSGITSNSATFNWTASANPTQWQVQYKSTNQGSKWIDVTVSGTARSVTISSLAANQSYQWHIRAKCGKTCTAYSNTVNFKTLTKTRTTVNTSSIVTKAEPIDKGIRLYPNPSRGQFVVELQVAEKINATAKIQLMNLEGQVVQAETALMNNGAVKQSVNVSPALSNGIYMVRISVNNKTYITRLVYQK